MPSTALNVLTWHLNWYNMIKKTVVFTGYTCNNKCIFCCNENKRGAYEDKKTDELKRNILEARRRGSSYLEIIGGEPTLRKDIVEIVSFAKSCGFKTIMFSTNGRMFSYDSFAKKIVKSGLITQFFLFMVIRKSYMTI